MAIADKLIINFKNLPEYRLTGILMYSITISGETHADLFKNLRAVAGGLLGGEPQTEEAVTGEAPARTRRSRNSGAATDTAATPNVDTGTTASAGAGPTIEQLRTKCQELNAAQKRDAMLKAMATFGGAVKLSEVPADQYGNFMTLLNAIK